ncbi:hypothetical protein JW756_02070 [Candidatus Woesearchaeota archaeon]|nr:hypothetical protein [Candidatus Woesearchaeota archaeon]
MGLRRTIRQGFRTLADPKSQFEALPGRSFEEVVEDYIIFLLIAGLFAGVMSLVYRFVYSGYLSVFKGITMNYWKLLNYSVGTSVSMFFFYLFAGTFLLFIVSIIVKIFVSGIKYTRLIAILIYSVTPLLLFNWIAPTLILPLIIWVLFLLVCGVKTVKQLQLRDIKEKKEVIQKKKAVSKK